MSVKLNAPDSRLPIDHNILLNVGTNTHPQIDEYIQEYLTAIQGYPDLNRKLLSIINLINNRIDEAQNIPAIPSERIIVSETGQIEINLSNEYVMGINMLYVFRNGIYQHINQDYYEMSTTQIVFPADTLVEDDVVDVRYVTSDNINLGDIRVVATLADLQDLDVEEHTIAMVMYEKKFYVYQAGEWKPLIEMDYINSIGLYFLYERQQVINTKQVYTLTKIKYSPGMHSLMVFVDGKKLSEDEYIEVDSRTVAFNTAFTTEQVIEFLSVNTDSWEETYEHRVRYLYDKDLYGNDVIVGEEWVDNDSNTVKNIMYVYNADGSIHYEVISKGSKTIRREYVYNNGNISDVIVTIT